MREKSSIAWMRQRNISIFGNAETLKRKRVNRKRYRGTSAISGFESPTYLQFTLDDHPADWDRNKDQGF